ncbi:MAG: respiratory nitrate reductase subunit gamma [candidate division Zixibacteria bacterium]|nr:respiratory nitrate reductase subunit gamma [candidate division Zixibacteria bacterium]MDH3938201.1 respiratory nitrate reductase subunit gamma [candidate division Zixibacteria bacterium]
MGSFLTDYNQLLFGVLPYMALFVFFLVTIQRYRAQSFSYSSLSSQFLENQFHFWGMVPFHYGILTILTGHLVAFLIPEQLLAWNRVPWRLFVLEISALIFAVLALVGLVNLIVRRRKYSKINEVTSVSDWILLIMLAAQVAIGIYIAVVYRWGSSWYATSMTPYLWSLVKFSPNVTYMSGMPWMVKLHVVLAFGLVTFFPFTRLVHILVVPNPYLWRRTQVVRWYKDRRKARLTT